MSDNFVIHFMEEGSAGYLFVKGLGKGVDGEAILIRSIDTGKLFVRKFAHQTDPDDSSTKLTPWLPSNEVHFMRALSNSGYTPQFVSREGCDQYPLSMTQEYCEGGTAFSYWMSVLRTASRSEREAFLWLLIAQGLRTLTYLQTGYTYVESSEQCWTKAYSKGKWLPPPPENTPWHHIDHGDAHCNNVFLSWSEASGAAPRVLLGDWSRAEYAENMILPDGVRPEVMEMTFFVKSILGSLHPRPTLAVERMTTEILKQMTNGKSTLDLAQGGLYNECMHRFNTLKVTLPKPLSVPGAGKAKVFSLTPAPAWSRVNHLSDMHSLNDALNIGGPYKLLKIPSMDVSELGEIDLTRAVEISRDMIKNGRFVGSKTIIESRCRDEAIVAVDLATGIPVCDFE